MMAEIIGVDTKIEKDRFKKIYSQNSGQKITTEIDKVLYII